MTIRKVKRRDTVAVWVHVYILLIYQVPVAGRGCANSVNSCLLLLPCLVMYMILTALLRSYKMTGAGAESTFTSWILIKSSGGGIHSQQTH